MQFINTMGLGIKDLFTGGIAGVLDSAKGVINQFVADPAQKAAAIQALENEANRHEETLIAQANEVEKAYLVDTQNARDDNAKIQESPNASWLAKNVGYILDLFLGTIWGSITITIIAKAFKLVGAEIDWTTILSIYSTVTALFGTSLNFHRGSSAGSKAKAEQIDRLTKGK